MWRRTISANNQLILEYLIFEDPYSTTELNTPLLPDQAPFVSRDYSKNYGSHKPHNNKPHK